MLQQKQPSLVNDFSLSGGYGSLLPSHGLSPSRTDRARWEAAAQKGSLEAVLHLVSYENARHDPSRTACHRCDIVADMYLSVLEYLSVKAMKEGQVQCSHSLLELVTGMSQMVVEHTFYQEGWWFDSLVMRLWSLAKHIKDESRGADCHVTTALSLNQAPTILVSEPDGSIAVDEQEELRRAIRITVYSARANIYRQNKQIDRAIVYFRKCLAVSQPRTFVPQQRLQESAKESLQALITLTMNHSIPIRASRSSSISSNESKTSTSATCANCGIEKRAMPVCAKCRIQNYCSHRCVVADKQAHDKDCQPRSQRR